MVLSVFRIDPNPKSKIAIRSSATDLRFGHPATAVRFIAWEMTTWDEAAVERRTGSREPP
jgi:hypothetical protein